MEKSYETYAKKALMLKHTHKQEAGKIRDTISQIDSNQRLSDFGKREAIEKLKGEAGNLNKQFSDSIRGLIRQFCKEFGTSFAEDYADHSTDVAKILLYEKSIASSPVHLRSCTIDAQSSNFILRSCAFL